MGFFQKWLGKSQPAPPPVQPEDLYHTELTDTGVTVTHPKRAPESIRWDEIDRIILINTDEGPMLPDIWLVLAGSEQGCTIPSGSKGWDAVYDIVSKYEGFNFENVIRSAGCTGNEVFELWRRPA